MLIWICHVGLLFPPVVHVSLLHFQLLRPSFSRIRSVQLLSYQQGSLLCAWACTTVSARLPACVNVLFN
jgi:hypothetical protein